MPEFLEIFDLLDILGLHASDVVLCAKNYYEVVLETLRANGTIIHPAQTLRCLKHLGKWHVYSYHKFPGCQRSARELGGFELVI